MAFICKHVFLKILPWYHLLTTCYNAVPHLLRRTLSTNATNESWTDFKGTRYRGGRAKEVITIRVKPSFHSNLKFNLFTVIFLNLPQSFSSLNQAPLSHQT